MTNTEIKKAVANAKVNFVEDIILSLSCEDITNVLRNLEIWNEDIYVAEWTRGCLEDAHNFALEVYNDFTADVAQGNDYYLIVKREHRQYGTCSAVGFHSEREEFEAQVPVRKAAEKICELGNYVILTDYISNDILTGANADPNGMWSMFFQDIKPCFEEDMILKMQRRLPFMELLKADVDAIVSHSASGKWKWVAESNDGSFQDESRCVFDTKEEAYNDMRSAALEKMKWNTEWTDVIDGVGEDNDDSSLGYEVHFCPSWIEHTSYSGTYTYKIIPATSEDLLHMQRKPKISREEAAMFISMYGYYRIRTELEEDITFELDGWSGETGIIGEWIDEFYLESANFDFDNTSIYDYAEEFIFDKLCFIRNNPNTAYLEYRYR